MHETPCTLGIIGDPLEETMSPALHNGLAKLYALPYVYLPFRVQPAHLTNLVRCMRMMDVVGLNVTAPYKMRVASLVDALDPLAAQSGAVNTLVMRRGRVKGYNTDGPGFLAALAQQFATRPQGKTIVLLGAGGGARAIGVTLVRSRAAHITIINRSRARATRLARELRTLTRHTTIHTAAADATSVRKAFMAHNMVVQATSAPRSGRGAIRWPARCATPGLIVSDIRYGSGPNTFLDGARAAGAKTADGFEMLIQQAARSFFLWTHTTVDLPLLRRLGRAALKNHYGTSKNSVINPMMSFPRRRESRDFNNFLDPRLRGDDKEGSF